jgi:hypothetical protein
VFKVAEALGAHEKPIDELKIDKPEENGARIDQNRFNFKSFHLSNSPIERMLQW